MLKEDTMEANEHFIMVSSLIGLVYFLLMWKLNEITDQLKASIYDPLAEIQFHLNFNGG